ncbi:2-aminomuconate deaminase [Leptolyngbya valderiana BDU 20041]|nr:2-aminomuconate deaminase [Leptolyngbya valderiana BDU 20041]
MSDSISTDAAPKPVGAYPHARRVGDLLFCSGVGPRAPGDSSVPGVTLDDAGELVDYDFEAQCRACFENIRAVVEAGGARFQDIVDVQVYLTDIPRDFKAFNALWKEYFAGEGKPNPCRTTIEVSRLPQGGNAPIAVELKVVAALRR